MKPAGNLELGSTGELLPASVTCRRRCAKYYVNDCHGDGGRVMARRDYSRLRSGRALWIVGGLLLGLFCAGALTLLSTPIYAASVTFYLKVSDSSGGLDQAYSGSRLAAQKAKSYLELITGERVRVEVSRQLNAPVVPGQITAVWEPDSVLLTATATDASARRAQDIANSIGAAFPDLVLEVERLSGALSIPLEVSVVSPAVLPTAPVSPLSKADLAFGAVLGLLVGCEVVLLRQPVLAALAERTRWRPC